MFAPIFCGQVVTGSWRGFQWRWLTIEGRVGRGGGGTLVSTVWPGQRGEAPPSVASASAVVVSVSSGAWCRLTFTDICTWTADYSHRGRSKRSEGGGGGGVGAWVWGFANADFAFRPHCPDHPAPVCASFYVFPYICVSYPLLYSPLLSSPLLFILFFFFLAAICGSSSKIQRITREKKTRNFAKILLT